VVIESEHFFWSPDSKNIAFLTSQDELNFLQVLGIANHNFTLGVHNSETGATSVAPTSFAPSSRFSQYAAFFDQYSLCESPQFFFWNPAAGQCCHCVFLHCPV